MLIGISICEGTDGSTPGLRQIQKLREVELIGSISSMNVILPLSQQALMELKPCTRLRIIQRRSSCISKDLDIAYIR